MPIRRVELRSDYDEGWYTRGVHATVETDDHAYPVEGEVWSTIPLRNRRNGLMTRITEGMTTWRCEGHEGAGLSEYLDQIVDPSNDDRNNRDKPAQNQERRRAALTDRR